jgi:hypothetical protein
MKLLLSLINKLYGSKAIQKTIGTRTNVITLPNKQTKQLLNEQLNVNQASDQEILKLKDDIEKLIPDIPKMNDSEVLNLTSNLQKIDNRLNPPQAEIIEMGTKQPVSPAGIKQLEAERGMPENVDPNSPLGIIMQRVKKAELESKSIAEEFGMENVLKKGLDDLMRTQTGYPSIQREGMVRTAVREIMTKDLKSGKLKIKDPEVKRNLEKYISSGEDPIETFRKYYGEDRLADIDDVAEELLPAQSYTEIQDILKQKKLYDLPVKKKGAGEYDPAIKEGEKINKDIEKGKIKPMNVTPAEDIIKKGDFDPSGMATGGRVGFSQGKLVGKGITKLLERFAKDKKKSRLLTDDEIEEFAEELGDTETWMSSGTLKEAEEAAKRRKDYEQQMYSEYQVDKQGRKELEQAYKEIDFRMTGEDTKYEANELADMLAETRYKTEMSDLPQKTQIDLYGEAYDYLMEVKRDATNFKGAVDIKSGKNIVTGEQELPLDSMTGKPRKLNATGGRVGFSDGDITKTKADYEKELEELDFSLKKEDNKILDILDLQAQGSMSGEKQIAGAPAGVTSNKQVINAILKLDIPISEKINLIGDYQYGKFRDKIKYNDKEVYLEDPGSSKNRKIGLSYNEDGEGFSGYGKYNIDTGETEGGIKLIKKFNEGGRVGFSDGGNEALLEQLYEKFLDLGLSPKDAADAARKEFEQRARKAGGGIAYLMGL